MMSVIKSLWWILIVILKSFCCQSATRAHCNQALKRLDFISVHFFSGG